MSDDPKDKLAHRGRVIPGRNALEVVGGPNGRLFARELKRLALHAKDEATRVKALAVIAPYVWRKQADRLEVTGANGGPLEVHDHFVGIGVVVSPTPPVHTAAPLTHQVVEALVSAHDASAVELSGDPSLAYLDASPDVHAPSADGDRPPMGAQNDGGVEGHRFGGDRE